MRLHRIDWRERLSAGLRVVTPEGARRLVWLAVSLALFGLFLKLTQELNEDAVWRGLDRRVLIWVAGFRRPVLNGVAVELTALGSPAVVGLLCTAEVAILLVIRRDVAAAAYLTIGSAGAGLGTLVLKDVFTRPRPEIVPRLVEVTGFSYPSGHSFGATSFYLLLMFLAFRSYPARRARILFAVLAGIFIGLVCLSRVYLGVHYPSDVLSGILLGSAWSCLLTAAFSRRAR